MKKNSSKLAIKVFIVAILLIAAASASVMLLKKKAQPEFNVILISIDTLRADHLGCYQYGRNTSPSVDAFSKDAVLFKTCIAQSTSTLASHASILTSKIVSHHGAYFTRSQPLQDNIPTMAELLKKNGCRTISFNDGGQIAPEFGLDRGFDRYESIPFKKPEEMTFKRIVDKTAGWLQKNKNQRFFLFLHTYETHHPYTPEQEYLELFEKEYGGNLPKHISVELIKRINNGDVQLEERDKQHIINTYDAEIRAMDESFGRLIHILKENGLYDNTLIIFTSDHGEEFGEHGIWANHSHALYNEQLLVPLIVKFPAALEISKSISKNSSKKLQKDVFLTVDRMVRSIDILPTVMDALEEKTAPGFEGVSLLPLIKHISQNSRNENSENNADDADDAQAKWTEDVFAISQRDMQKTYPRRYWAIIKGKWKLYDKKLYNLALDPGELTDSSKTDISKKKELESLALSFMKRRGKRAAKKKVKLDKGLKEKLKTLGYID